MDMREFTVYEMTYDKREVPECGIECVPFLEGYLDEYKRIYNECFRPMREALDIRPYDWYSEGREVPEDRSGIFLIVEDGELAGSVSIIGNEVDGLFVAEAYHGKGHGRELLLWAMNKIREQNSEAITLHVAKWNSGAAALYESVGCIKSRTMSLGR